MYCELITLSSTLHGISTQTIIQKVKALDNKDLSLPSLFKIERFMLLWDGRLDKQVVYYYAITV